MKLGKICVALILGLSSVAFSAKTDPKFLICLKSSLKRSTPIERDEARLACMRRHVNINLSTCTQEAQRMEYLLNEQVALKECYYTRTQSWSLANCFNVAKKLHTLSDRDGMRLDCLTQMSLPKDKGNCLKLANSFEQRQHKLRFVSVCLEH